MLQEYANLSEALVYARSSPRSVTASPRARAGWLAVLALLALGGCQSASDKANAYEALYDRMMPQRAYPAALVSITRATALEENEPRRWIKLGNVQMALSRPSAAYVAFQHALDLAPDNVEVLQNLSILSVRARDYQNAKRYVETLLVLAPNNQNGLLASGAIATYERRYAQAEEIADQMIAAAPDQPEGYALQILNLREQGRTAEAAAILERRSTVNPEDGSLLLQLLEIYRARGDVAGVRRTALRLAPLYPDDPRYAMESVRALHAEGRKAEAEERLTALTRRYRFNPALVLAVAQFRRQTLPPETALAQIVQLADRGSPAIKAALGNVMLDMGAIPQTVALLAPIARGSIAADTIDPHITLARTLFLAGRPADAAARVARILDYDATNVPALVLRARLQFARQDYPAALNDAQLAAAGDQTNQEAALLIGQTYAAMGKSSLALKAFGQARQAFPDSMAVVQAWSDTALAQRDTAQALSVVADFARRHPRSDTAWTLYGKLCRTADDLLCDHEVSAHRQP